MAILTKYKDILSVVTWHDMIIALYFVTMTKTSFYHKILCYYDRPYIILIMSIGFAKINSRTIKIS